jgi:F-type H+-transporting ATPase subunit delta
VTGTSGAARRYAKAVFDLASQEGSFEQWGRRMATIQELFSRPEVALVLNNPTIATEQRESLVANAPEILDEQATNLARLLIESGRIDEARAIAEEYQRMVDDAQGRVRATLTTASELAPHDRDRVAAELSKRLNKDVRLTTEVDPRILGGLRLQYGDRVVDASVAARLEQLRRRLAAT